MKQVHIFTHRDLDGAASYLVASWFCTAPDIHITYTPVSSVAKMRDEITTWLANNSFEDYNRIYFLDLDTSSIKDIIDKENVTIIDHHLSHAEFIADDGAYTNAKAAVVEYTSCCKLLYKIFSRQNPSIKLTSHQKALIAICDDYDCYKLDIKYSKPLNCVFYSYNNSFDSFVKRFYNGFDGFNARELNMIKIHKDTLDSIINNLETYHGTLGKYIVVAGFADKCINEVHEYMLQEYDDADISIVVMGSTNRVSWRKQTDCPAMVNEIAERLCNGGGHEYAAGGVVTPAFEKFTQTLIYETRK